MSGDRSAFDAHRARSAPTPGLRGPIQPSNSRALLATALLLYALSIAATMRKEHFQFAVSDGRFYYAYLPSVLIDHDLDFGNQIAQHWDVDYNPSLLDERTPIGRVRNKYPIGLAISLAPAFLVGHGVTRLTNILGWSTAPADGYSVFYQLAMLAGVQLYGLCTWLVLNRWISSLWNNAEPARLGEQNEPSDPGEPSDSRIRGRTSALLAILAYWLGTPYLYYYLREPIMVHVVSTFWVTLSVIALEQAPVSFHEAKRARSRGWSIGTGFCLGMALVCRPTNIFVLPHFWTLIVRAIRHPGEIVGAFSFLILGAVGPIGAQLLTWRLLSGRWLHYSYGDEGFHWTSPALLQTLLSTRHGLFTWCPMLILSLIGLVASFRSGRACPRQSLETVSAPPHPALSLGGERVKNQPLLIRGIVSFAILWYLNSAWHMWWFGDAFGARSFLEISWLFVIGLTLFLEPRAGSASKANEIGRWKLVLIAGCGGFNLLLMGCYIARLIPRG